MLERDERRGKEHTIGAVVLARDERSRAETSGLGAGQALDLLDVARHLLARVDLLDAAQ